MFESVDSIPQTMSIAIVGIGTVGSKIAKQISISLDYDQVVSVFFLHHSEEFLEELTFKDEEKIIASDSYSDLKNRMLDGITGKDIVFLVSGLGGETGSRLSPFISKVVSDNNILCIGLFSFPFDFEGRRKRGASQRAYVELLKYTDSIICINNDSFLKSSFLNQEISRSEDLFLDSNNHFEAVIKSMVNLVTRPGMINVDFADLQTIISDMGTSTVSFARVKGEFRAESSVRKLLKSPALDNHNLTEARGWLVCITAGLDLSLGEFSTVGDEIEAVAGYDATIVVGTVIDPEMESEFEVIVVLTGLPEYGFKEDVEDEHYDIVAISKTITFEPHQASSGLSILSYFNDFLHQKYKETKAKVRIEQNGNTVKLVVESPSGEIEVIEKSLDEYGLVVLGERKAEEILENKLDAERLKMKLEMAALELRNSEKILLMYQTDNSSFKERISSLEGQLDHLQKTICAGLTRSQRDISSQLRRKDVIPKELIDLIQNASKIELTDRRKEEIQNTIQPYKQEKAVIDGLREFLESTVHGVTGNAAYSFILSLLNTLPK